LQPRPAPVAVPALNRWWFTAIGSLPHLSGGFGYEQGCTSIYGRRGGIVSKPYEQESWRQSDFREDDLPL
jgi:hypothetical protein